MKGITYVNGIDLICNEPLSTESTPTTSILPERFRSISKPSEVPINSEELNSITAPKNSVEFISEKIKK